MSRGVKIISGGQTGVDRAALQWALDNGVPHGGWCPKGRKAEDGVIPPEFQLAETETDDYTVRTRRNVEDSDGTAIFCESLELSGGTRETAIAAKELGKPLLVLDSPIGAIEAAKRLARFLSNHRMTTLNIAGPRESEAPGLRTFVTEVLSRAFCAPKF